MKALMFLNPKRKKNPYTKSSKRTVRAFPGTTSKIMAKKKKKSKKYSVKKTSAKRARAKTARRASRPRRASRSRRSGSRRLRVASTGSGVLVTNPRRRRRSRRSHRRGVRRNPGMTGSLMSTVRGAFSKDNLAIAGGALAATALTRVLIDKTVKTADNPNPLNLPLLNDKTDADKRGMGIVVYSVATPLLAAFLIRRRMPSLSKGLVLGSIINGVSELIRQNSADNYNKYLASPQEAYATSLIQPVKAYLNRSNIPNMLPVGLIPGTRTPGYSGSNLFPRVRTTNGALDNSRAFPTDAW